jgi:hypothetical protein
MTLLIVHGTRVVNAGLPLTCSPTRENVMKQSDMFRENAENCAQLAEATTSEPAFQRYKRMEASWRALADEQDWLDGEISPARIPAQDANGSAAARPERSKSAR